MTFLCYFDVVLDFFSLKLRLEEEETWVCSENFCGS